MTHLMRNIFGSFSWLLYYYSLFQPGKSGEVEKRHGYSHKHLYNYVATCHRDSYRTDTEKKSFKNKNGQ